MLKQACSCCSTLGRIRFRTDTATPRSPQPLRAREAVRHCAKVAGPEAIDRESFAALSSAAQRADMGSAEFLDVTRWRRRERYGSSAGALPSQASNDAENGANTGIVLMAAATSCTLATVSSLAEAARSRPLAASRLARSALQAKMLS